jgi:hypothetical protein
MNFEVPRMFAVLSCIIQVHLSSFIPRSSYSGWPYNPFDRMTFKPGTESHRIGLGLTCSESIHDQYVMGHVSLGKEPLPIPRFGM